MTAPDDPRLARVLEARQAVDLGEQDLAARRRELWRQVRVAHEQGVSLTALGRVLGVSRQRVAQLLERGE